MAEETKTYTLVSNDQKKFTISEKAAFLCNVVQDMVKVVTFGKFCISTYLEFGTVQWRGTFR